MLFTKNKYRELRFNFLCNKFNTNREIIEYALDKFYGPDRNKNIITYSDYAVKNALTSFYKQKDKK